MMSQYLSSAAVVIGAFGLTHFVTISIRDKTLVPKVGVLLPTLSTRVSYVDFTNFFKPNPLALIITLSCCWVKNEHLILIIIHNVK